VEGSLLAKGSVTVGLGFGVEARMKVERYFEAGEGAKAV
jgi:hypothetical protein